MGNRICLGFIKFTLKQIAYAGCSKYKSYQNHKTAGINQEPDFIRGSGAG